MLKKKIWANFQRIVEVFTQKIFNMLSNIWVWDPGSGKNLFRIPDPGVKKAPDPGSGTLPVPGHADSSLGCVESSFFCNKQNVKISTDDTRNRQIVTGLSHYPYVGSPSGRCSPSQMMQFWELVCTVPAMIQKSFLNGTG
jgi:hypothetical protein